MIAYNFENFEVRKTEKATEVDKNTFMVITL